MYITLENIKKEYNNKNVIDGLSCAFYSGRIYVIKGVSGCGKTTLLNIISGVEANYSGDAVHSCDQTIEHRLCLPAKHADVISDHYGESEAYIGR